MCGYLASFGRNPLRESELLEAKASLRLRGPDDEHLVSGNQFDLFHTRLAIQEKVNKDVQPYIVDNRYYLVYNGEIYNYRELRRELEGLGQRFVADGDTEVLARGLAHFGEEFLKKTNGMFSFVFYDQRERTVLFARDRVGIKPLFYSLEEGLLVSTNSQVIQRISGNQISEQKLEIVLNFRYSLTGKSIYKNIHSLPPGHYAKWFSGAPLEVKSYWELPARSESLLTAQDYEDNFESLLRESIELRTLSKFPVTSLLSGGVDSSYIALCAKELGQIDCVYTLKLEENKSDVEGATKISKGVGLKQILLESSDDDEFWYREWDEALQHLEEPIVDTIIGPTNFLFKSMRKDFKVCLSGEGADELMAGYVHHALSRKIEKFKSFLPSAFISALFPILWQLAKNFSPYPGKFSSLEKRKLIHFMQEKDPAKAVEILISLSSNYNNHLHSTNIQSPGLEDVWRFDFSHWLPNYTLKRLDSLSASHAVEARVPFLDHRLIEFVFRNGSERLWGNLGDKQPLRRCHLKKYLESSVWNKKKTPFVLAAKDTLSSRNTERMIETIEEGSRRSQAVAKFNGKNQLVHKLKHQFSLSPLELKQIHSAYLTARWLEVRS